MPSRRVRAIHWLRPCSDHANGLRAQTLRPASRSDGRGSRASRRAVDVREGKGRVPHRTAGKRKARTIYRRLCAWFGSSCDDIRDRSRPSPSQDSRAPFDLLCPRERAGDHARSGGGQRVAWNNAGWSRAVRPRDPEVLRLSCDPALGALAQDLEPVSMIPSVTCERCHGPGRAHVDAARRGARAEELSMPMGMEGWTVQTQLKLCGSCHRHPSWVPPERLNANDPGLARFQPIGLSQSRCFKGSEGRLSCVSCHDPHARSTSDPAYYERRLSELPRDARERKDGGERTGNRTFSRSLGLPDLPVAWLRRLPHAGSRFRAACSVH